MRSQHHSLPGDASLLHPALWPALGLLALYAFSYVQLSVQLIAFPFGIDQGEGYDVWAAWLIRLGQLPYTANEADPYYSSNYPPVWSALVAIPMAWTGPSLAPARLVSTLSALAAGLLIGLAAYRRTREEFPPDQPTGPASSQTPRRGLERRALLAAALAGGLFFASPYVFHTTPLARVNSMSLCFALLAVSLFEVPRRGASDIPLRPGLRANSRLLLGTLALLAALFTKPTAADAAVACLASIWLISPTRALLASTLLGGFGLIGLACFNVMTQGAFWTNVMAANVNPFDIGQLGSYLLNFGLLHGVILFLAGVELVRSVRRSLWSPWVCYLIASGVLALGVGKWGAGESYFLSMIAAACVLAAPGIVRLVPGATGDRQQATGTDARSPSPSPPPTAAVSSRAAWAVGAALALQLALSAHGPLSELAPWLPDRGAQADFLGRAPSPADREVGEAIVALLRDVDGPVLSEEPSFAVLAGKEVVGNATQLRNLYQAGLWDPEALVADVRGRRFDAVILNAELYPAPVLAAIGRSYYVVRSVQMRGATYKIFLPGGD